MADSDLDYCKIVGRIALAVGDGPDSGENPDLIFPDRGGTVTFEPLQKYVKVDGAVPPVTVGGANIVAHIDEYNGYITYPEPAVGNDGALTYGAQRVWLLDLGSEKVNPVIARDKAAYRVTFKVSFNGVKVDFPSFTFHPLPGVDNDLTLLAPVPVGGGQAIVVGPAGPKVVTTKRVGDSFALVLEDGSETNAIPLLAGPQGDPGLNALGAEQNAATVGQYIGAETPARVESRALVKDQQDGLDWILTRPVETLPTTNDVYPIGSIGTVAYGRKAGGGLYQSTDGETWTLLTNAATGNSIHLLGNGEILLNQGRTLARSTGWAANPATATFATVLTGNGLSNFLTCAVDVWGQYVLAGEYRLPRDDARYVYLSTDHGATFTIVRDLQLMFPDQKPSTHWHAVTLDPWAGLAHPRLWCTHGDGPRGVYYSDDLGQTWTTYDADWQPMPIVATPNGIITSTDTNDPDGVWVIPRDLSPKRLLYKIPARRWDHALLGFGIAAHRDENNVVYILFKADQKTYFTEGVPGMILASDGIRASLMYRTQRAGDVGSSTSVNWIGKPTLIKDKLIAAYQDPTTSATRVVTGRPRRGNQPRRDEGNLRDGVAKGRADMAAGVGVVAERDSMVLGHEASASAATGSATAALSATALGQFAHAETQGIAVGASSSATGVKVTAVGHDARVQPSGTATTGAEGVAVGASARANQNATGVGTSVAATGTNATGVGRLAEATEQGTTAVGHQAKAKAVGASAFGAAVEVTGQNATGIGSNTKATGQSSGAFGRTANATHTGAYAIGESVTASHQRSTALGYLTVTTDTRQLAIGAMHIEADALTTPPNGAPAAGKARQWFRTNGSGKIEWVVQGPTGGATVIWTQP